MAKILTYNKNLIHKTLGRQGQSQCGVYSVAYGWTILEGKCRVSGSPASHQSVANKYNGGYFAVCHWSTMGCTSHTASSWTARYAAYRKEIDAGRPVVNAGKGSSINHYVCVIGYRNGGNKPSDFYILDPADNKEGWFGSTWAPGMDNGGYGKQYITFNTKKRAGTNGSAGGSVADHPRKWYTKKYGNEAKVYFEMRDLGYSHKGTCAIMGNISQESGFRTTAVSGDGYGSTGLCQWTGGRLTNLKNFAKKKGLDWQTVHCQCLFLNKELTDSYKDLKSELKKGKKTIYSMTYDFCFTFERPAKWAANMENRSNKAKLYYTRYKKAFGGEGEAGEEGTTGGGSIDMKKRSSVLYTSDNYQFVDLELAEKKQEDKYSTEYKEFIKNMNFVSGRTAVADSVVLKGMAVDSVTKPKINKVKSTLQISDALIQAPFVELELGQFTVGSYRNSADDYPNHITRLEVEKINGEINKYTIGLVHQIRAGEDPNVLDKIFSSVRYDKIHIRYGDCESGSTFKDVEAIITNIVDNRDYAGSRITYTVYATSACNYVSSIRLNFPGTTDKPSNVIKNLLYGKGEISNALVSVFPGMADRSKVESNNYIASNDTVLQIDARSNITVLDYVKYLTGCMSNAAASVNDILRNSTYYLTYDDNASGSYFRITEGDRTNSKNIRNVFSVTVGYPDGNDILGFDVTSNNAWQLLYNNGQVSSEFYYDVDSDGNVLQMPSKSLFNRSQIMSEVQKNWWTQMINFPISATLNLRGLLKPVNLMDHILIDVVFYGQRHITSGLYIVTGQKDILDGSGFKTSLSLIRVGDS